MATASEKGSRSCPEQLLAQPEGPSQAQRRPRLLRLTLGLDGVNPCGQRRDPVKTAGQSEQRAAVGRDPHVYHTQNEKGPHPSYSISIGVVFIQYVYVWHDMLLVHSGVALGHA